MASSSKLRKIVLSEKDVPGATLCESKSIEGHSVCELKRYLVCRGQTVGGKKSELVERVKRCIDNNEPLSNDVDGGVWYNKKLKKTQEERSEAHLQPPPFPISGWKTFHSKDIPKNFCYGVIYEHFLKVEAVLILEEEDSDSDKENMNCMEYNTSKPIRKGEIYFKSGHVKNICDNEVGNYYCIKADVMASFTKSKTYKVLIMLHKDEASVADSSCNCRASALGRCSHVSALLFALDDYVKRFGYTAQACTSKICSWNVGRKSNKDPAPVASNSYNYKIDPMKKVDFQPTVYDADMYLANNSLLSSVQQLTGTTMWELSLSYQYSDYELSVERRKELIQNVGQLQEALLFGCKEESEVHGTEGQSKSPKWCQLRKLLITASGCKNIFTANPEDYMSILKKSLWSCDEQLISKYTEHGILHEKHAREEYEIRMGVKVTESGLYINPKYIGMACSPDGIVYDPLTDTTGLLEIKCPYVLKDFKPEELDKLTSRQRSAFCCLLKDDGTLTLKTSHKYYYQVQMCMALLEKQWCDFVIWTFSGFHCERITFNPVFWEKLYEKLSDFHTTVLCPEYFEMRVPRKLKPYHLNL